MNSKDDNGNIVYLPQRLHDLDERIIKARQTVGDCNCHGTALYVAGLAEKDSFTTNAWEKLYYLPVSEQPERGYIAAFVRDKPSSERMYQTIPLVSHTAVVTHKGNDEVLVAHRERRGGALVENYPLDKLVEQYIGHNVVFYNPIPKKQI